MADFDQIVWETLQAFRFFIVDIYSVGSGMLELAPDSILAAVCN